MNQEPEQIFSFAGFELDAAHRSLRREGKPVGLHAKAFDLLTFLVKNAGNIVSRDEILDAVWAGQFVEESNLTVQISALRKILGESKNAPHFLVMIPGKGYKFVADVRNGKELVIERHSLSRIIVEEEIEGETGRQGEGESKINSVAVSPSPLLPVSLSSCLKRQQSVGSSFFSPSERLVTGFINEAVGSKVLLPVGLSRRKR